MEPDGQDFYDDDTLKKPDGLDPQEDPKDPSDTLTPNPKTNP